MNVHVSPSSPVSAVRVERTARRSAKTVTEFYAELERAHITYLAACATRDFDDNKAARDDLDRTLVDSALNKFTAIGERLVRTATANPQEMLLQLRVTLALNGAPLKSLSELDSFDDFENLDGEALLTLKYLRDGLRHLSACRAS